MAINHSHNLLKSGAQAQKLDLPSALAYAVTVHKAQWDTLRGCVFMYLCCASAPAQRMVMVSRAAVPLDLRFLPMARTGGAYPMSAATRLCRHA
jgi:hypothetical protein